MVMTKKRARKEEGSEGRKRPRDPGAETEIVPSRGGSGEPEVVGMGPQGDAGALVPVLLGHGTPTVERQARTFYLSVAAMFDAWIQRTQNPNTQRAYRQDVM